MNPSSRRLRALVGIGAAAVVLTASALVAAPALADDGDAPAGPVGTLSGTVHTSDGEPAAGASVSLETPAGDDAGASAATAGDDGTWTIDDAPAGVPLIVDVSPAGDDATDDSGDDATDDSGDSGDDGTDAEALQLQSASFAPDDYLEQWYRAGGDAYTTDMATPVSVAQGATSGGLDVTLHAGGSLHGTVTFGKAGVADADVEVRTASGDSFGSDVTTAKGGYAIDALPPGTWKVVVDPDGSTLKAIAATVTIVEGGDTAWNYSYGKAFTKTGKVVIAGTAKVGVTLKAVVAGFSPKPTLRYAWYLGSKRLAATKATLKVPATAKGKRLVVKVTATRSGFAPVVVASKATAPVKAAPKKAPAKSAPKSGKKK